MKRSPSAFNTTKMPTGCVWKCCVPLNPMVLLIIIPFLNGYFIGKFLPNIFRQTQRKIQVVFLGAIQAAGLWGLKIQPGFYGAASAIQVPSHHDIHGKCHVNVMEMSRKRTSAPEFLCYFWRYCGWWRNSSWELLVTNGNYQTLRLMGL